MLADLRRDGADKVILIETEDGVQRMTMGEMFDDFEGAQGMCGIKSAASGRNNRDGSVFGVRAGTRLWKEPPLSSPKQGIGNER